MTHALALAEALGENPRRVQRSLLDIQKALWTLEADNGLVLR